ncbi:hypothetical protein RclHR1_11510004 [Rhizophagus clarus]|uniref:F-box domain-containing protein n=1 Tax=Rhizophagus clarus TaxID=94130 RepID=A0A2Z6Q4M4_9GLOM|nr:hypothetical protein RclHR1_11510004 [Rhizophagus clarus]GES83995.1 hypothetical protein GLOIN_2v1764020 [Rhizophagus clarus]
MFTLNKDILFLIFEELQDDSKSLFSCLMVNRFLCETVVPILWMNPWSYNGINYRKKKYLFIIIASYITDDIKEFITKHRIQQLLSTLHRPLLFDYLSFCRSINVNTINSIVSIGSPSAYNKFFMQQEFYYLFMKKCPELKYLDMRSIKHQIYYFPDSKSRLESLCELTCDTSIDSTYFYGLSRYCQYIQRLVIINVDPNLNHGIVKLIKVQMNLKYFEWKDEDYLEFTRIDPYKEVLLALEKKAEIINHLKLFFLYVDNTLQQILPKLHKLKTLILNDFGFFNEDQVRMFAYRDLEVLMINCYALNATSIMIEKCGRKLKKILLEPYEFDDYVENFHDDSLLFIRKIHESCPSIEYLSLAFSPSKKHFSELEKLLRTCQNLKSLLLTIFNMDVIETDEKITENGEELLKVLIKSTPINLREIRFLDDIKFSLKALEEFLGKWSGCTLTILTSDPIYNGDDYKDLINKYKNDGAIKVFCCETFKNVVDMDFKI